MQLEKFKKAVCVSKYTQFDPSNPSATEPSAFVLMSAEEDGEIGDYFLKEGYIQVGTADVTITLMNTKDMTSRAVVALQKQKTAVIAKAQAEATEIERKIQSLLAITNDVA